MTATMPSTITKVARGQQVWRDGRRYLWVVGILVPVLPIAGVGLWHRTGHELFLWYTPFFVFVLVPLLDFIGGNDDVNPPMDALASLERDRYYRLCTFLYLPLQYVGLALACQEWVHGNLGWFGHVGLLVSIGTVSGIAINTAHELGHKRELLERRLSLVALAQTGYGHFFVEHNRGHHTRVATPEDPASARLGESFWQFLPRTVVGSARSAWKLEADRLALRHTRVWSRHNQVLRAWSMTVVLVLVLTVAFGPAVLPFFLLQGVFGFSLLEVVNYLEHYGLARQREAATGRYERVQPVHSWNSTTFMSNVALYHLQRHSDHHAHPTRRYQALQTSDDAPELPFGYPTMIMLATVPPLWRRVMDHRVIDFYEGDLSRVNLDPRHEDRYLTPALVGAPYPDEL